ncbi:unnamed protein product [Miscanthus lutarioriparius]|uniref:Uncharacterized protein n=1 Tax=Miscanthus lutarioriparius TaxID=422564 RepID=A0A811S0F2_9POAL|nr:unnamed protein product [Miscanthus lutarioriparius]
MDNTQENGVQQIQDPIIIDLIVEQDLRGILTDAIKLMIQKTNFKGRFESTWEQFSGSEPKDDGARILFPSGDTDVHVAVEPEAAAMPVAETEATPIHVVGRFIESDYGIKLIEEGLRSLEGEKSQNQCRFVHHDSIVNMNRGAAKRLVGNLKRLFPSFHSTFIEGQTPQQANGYDYVVLVIALSYKIVCWWNKVKSGQKTDTDWFDVVSKVNSKMVSDRRRQMFARLKKSAFDLSSRSYMGVASIPATCMGMGVASIPATCMGVPPKDERSGAESCWWSSCLLPNPHRERRRSLVLPRVGTTRALPPDPRTGRRSGPVEGARPRFADGVEARGRAWCGGAGVGTLGLRRQGRPHIARVQEGQPRRPSDQESTARRPWAE